MDPNVIVSEFIANHTELFGGFCCGMLCALVGIVAVTFCLGSWIVFFVWLRRFLRRRDQYNQIGGEQK